MSWDIPRHLRRLGQALIGGLNKASVRTEHKDACGVSQSGTSIPDAIGPSSGCTTYEASHDHASTCDDAEGRSQGPETGEPSERSQTENTLGGEDSQKHLPALTPLKHMRELEKERQLRCASRAAAPQSKSVTDPWQDPSACKDQVAMTGERRRVEQAGETGAPLKAGMGPAPANPIAGRVGSGGSPNLPLAAAESSTSMPAAPVYATTPAKVSTQHHSLKASEVIRILRGDASVATSLAREGRIDARDSVGDTALHIAARRGLGRLYESLVEAGASSGVSNNAGYSPADLWPRQKTSQSDRASERKEEALSTPNIQSGKTDGGEGSESFELILDESDNEDITFVGEADAGLFNEQAGFTVARASFQEIDAVTRVDEADGGTFDWDDNRDVVSIHGEGLSAARGLIADEELDSRREKNFLSLSWGRRGPDDAEAAQTEGHYLPADACAEWLEEVLERGVSLEGDLSELVSLCRGDFSEETVAANLRRALEDAGLLQEDNSTCDHPAALSLSSDVEIDEVAASLSAAATRSNRVPGDDFLLISKRRERMLFEELKWKKKEALSEISKSRIARASVLWWMQRVSAHEIAQLSAQAEVHAAIEELKSIIECEGKAEQFNISTSSATLTALSVLNPDLRFHDMVATHVAGHGEATDVLDAHKSLRASFDSLLLLHLPLARRVAVRHTQRGSDVDDRFQDACDGLSRAIWKFNPDHGNRFMTYAGTAIRQAIIRAYQDTGSIVRIPTHRHDTLSIIDRIMDGRERRALPQPSAEDLAEELGLDIEIISLMLGIPRVAVVFDERVHDDWMSDPLEAVHVKQRSIRLSQMFDILSEREQDVLRKRFGFNDDLPRTLEEIGEEYGVTRERVRQIEARALEKLGHPSRLRALRELI